MFSALKIDPLSTMKRSLNSRNDPFWWSRQLAQMAKKTMCVFLVHPLWGPTGRADRWIFCFSWGTSMGLFSKVLQQPVMPPVLMVIRGPSEWRNKRVYWCSWIGSVIDWGIADTSRGIIQDVPFSRPTLCTKHYSPANQHGWLEKIPKFKKKIRIFR